MTVRLILTGAVRLYLTSLAVKGFEDVRLAARASTYKW